MNFAAVQITTPREGVDAWQLSECDWRLIINIAVFWLQGCVIVLRLSDQERVRTFYFSYCYWHVDSLMKVHDSVLCVLREMHLPSCLPSRYKMIAVWSVMGSMWALFRFPLMLRPRETIYRSEYSRASFNYIRPSLFSVHPVTVRSPYVNVYLKWT
jgi:hypothetical protein